MVGKSAWAMTEAEFLAEIIPLCEQRGIALVHNNAPHHSRRRQDLIGFPDLLLCGTHRIAFRELKKQTARNLSPTQTTWKHRLIAAGQDYDMWRPSDLKYGRIERELDSLNRPSPGTRAGNADWTDRDFSRVMASAPDR